MKRFILLLTLLLPSLCLADLRWEVVRSYPYDVTRVAVPHGWIVMVNPNATNSAATFVMDENHSWEP